MYLRASGFLENLFISFFMCVMLFSNISFVYILYVCVYKKSNKIRAGRGL